MQKKRLSHTIKPAQAGLLLLSLLFTGFTVTPDPVPGTVFKSHSPLSIQFEASPADTLQWNRPRFSERGQERAYLVETGIIGQGITDPAVIEAMLNVPRHRFIPENEQRFAYLNQPLPIGFNQTISQPYIVALMAEILEVEPGHKVLEVGTGSGYHAAVLSELTPAVFTIEIVEPLGERAASLYRELGYETIEVRIGDGYNGWPEQAPFDRILVTAAADSVPRPLIDQLVPGGIIVMPVGDPADTQILTRLIKTEEGEIRTERVVPVRFVPLTREEEQP